MFYIYRTNVVLNYTEIEAKVREATNDEAWGPTGKMVLQYIMFCCFVHLLRVLVFFFFFIVLTIISKINNHN